MSNWTELKRLAEAAIDDFGIYDPSAAEQEFMSKVGPADVLALIAENERLRGDVRMLVRQHMPLQALEGMEGWSEVVEARKAVEQRDQLRAEVEALQNSLRQISNEVDCNMRPLIRDLVNRACGLDNGANPNDLYADCDRIDEIIDSALDSNQ